MVNFVNNYFIFALILIITSFAILLIIGSLHKKYPRIMSIRIVNLLVTSCIIGLTFASSIIYFSIFCISLSLLYLLIHSITDRIPEISKASSYITFTFILIILSYCADYVMCYGIKLFQLLLAPVFGKHKKDSGIAYFNVIKKNY